MNVQSAPHMVSVSDPQLNPGCVGIACDVDIQELEPQHCYNDLSVVRGLIRDAMLQSGLGRRNPAVPLADIIKPGQSVLLKPNWVYHRNQLQLGDECLITHSQFVLHALGEVVAAKPSRVILGDAPIQGCDWEALITPEFLSRVDAVASDSGVKIEVVDFRRTVTKTNDLGDGIDIDQRDLDRYVLFDLGKDSYLEPISSPRGRFRVTNYDPRELARRHQPGRHQYLLCKELFEADVMLQLPKLKTHRKAGITGAIKNIVGLNGNKDFLPHHRVGGSDSGGDCYQGRDLKMRTAEWLLDMANRSLGSLAYRPLRKLAALQSRCLRNAPIGGLEGSWHGNNTCWRMVLDLNRILRFGTVDGRIADKPQRSIYSLTDAIVCGQGDGPLAPEPLVVGAVTFASNSVAAEWIHCAILGLDPTKIPLVQQARAQSPWTLLERDSEPHGRLDSHQVSFEDIREMIGVRAKPPGGWEGQIELEVAVS